MSDQSSAAGTVVDATPVGRRWTAWFGLAWFGFWMANLVPVQLLLPDQFAAITPSDKVFTFALVNGIGGLVAVVMLPVCGVLSDRTRLRSGPRRSWIAAGAVLLAAGLVATGLQHTVAGIAIGWSVCTIGFSAMTAGLTAVIADRVPERQRGSVSAAIFGPQALGVVIGIALVTLFGLSTSAGYVIIAGVMLLSVLPFLRHHDDVTVDARARLTMADVLRPLRIGAQAHPDFAWAFGCRMLVNLGNSLGTCYLLYFLTDDLTVSDPNTSLLELTIVYLVAGIIATVLAGGASDRSGRRRVFVLWAAALQAFAGVLLAIVPTLPVTFAAAALLGAGFGAYMATDQALVTQVLPDARDRAKDLGVMNIATIVPPAVAPLIAGSLISSSAGYPLLFAAVGVTAGLGAAVVYRVRSVA